MHVKGNTILITGGSAGIGLAIAKALVAANNTVIICGRDTRRLDQVKRETPDIHVIVCDVAQDDQLVALVNTVTRDFPQLNILINNAAMMQIHDFVTSDDTLERIESEVRTNLLAPLKLTRLFLPVLQQQPAAAIVIVSSGLAYVPVAHVAVYCATKAALHSFSQAMRHRLRKTSVKVFELLPPLTHTELVQPLRMPKIPPQQVAKALLQGLAQDRYEMRVGQVKSLRILSQLAPNLTQRLLNKAFSR